MTEVGVVIALSGEPIYWHLPVDRTATSLPDSRVLWEVLWDQRKRILGFAHSHPRCLAPSPSHTDVTTFAAVEDALGGRLAWWITGEHELVLARWVGPERLGYETVVVASEPAWAAMLRRASR